MTIHVHSETGLLREVLLGSVEHFHLHPPINETQRYYYAVDPPRVQVMIEQQAEFVRVFERYGVKIHWVTPRPDSPVQFNTRDVATVIGKTLVTCLMKEPLRKNEIQSLEPLLRQIDTPVLQVDTGIIEGGDIILDNDVLYVGLSERTDLSGLEWLTQHFGNRFEIVPMKLKPPFLHLDVVFNLVGDKLALVYANAIDPESLEILRKRYTIVSLTKEEQFALGTNVFSLSPETVISGSNQARLNQILAKAGLEVVAIDYSELAKVGGSFRCSTCPLVRD